MSFRQLSILALLGLTALIGILSGQGPSQTAEAGALGSGTVTVTTPLDNSVGGDGLCSIREAINASNIDAAGASGCVGTGSGPDRIIFNLGPAAVINIGQPLMPSVTETVEIDGGPGRVELRGQGDQFAGAGIAFSSASASDSVVKNLAINGFTNAIQIGANVDGVHILSNFIGTNASGTVGLGNLYSGITVEGPNSLIGGTDGWSPGGSCTGDCNLISGGGTGIAIAGGGLGAKIQGNMLGTDVTGTLPLPNPTGITAQAANPLIGGPGNGEGNLISSGSAGIAVTLNGTATIQGNFIGTDTSGTSLIDPKDFSTGIYLSQGQNVLIGGDFDGTRNVIAYFEGVRVADSSGVIIVGNFIGTAANGTTPLVPDTDESTTGVTIFRGQYTNVGSIAPGEGNVIAYHDVGVVVTKSESTFNAIRGNSIHSNTGLGIDTREGGNGEVPPPAIANATASGANGTASSLDCVLLVCRVDVYSDDADEGRVYEGSTQADAGGNWSVSASLDGPNVTATITYGGATSEFSAPFTLPAPTPTPSPTPIASPTTTPTPTATATATPTPTPTATASHSPSPSPSPTPTVTPGPGTQRQWGDADCNTAVAPRDGQAILNVFLDKTPIGQTEPCPDIGGAITVAGFANATKWGDFDCNGVVTPRDGQAVLNVFLGKIPLSQTEPCPDIGTGNPVSP